MFEYCRQTFPRIAFESLILSRVVPSIIRVTQRSLTHQFHFLTVFSFQLFYFVKRGRSNVDTSL